MNLITVPAGLQQDAISRAHQFRRVVLAAVNSLGG